VFFTNELASGPHTFLVECGDQQGNFTLSAPQSITLQPPCGPANCANGCCINKQCINPTAHACGINGVACVDCGSGGCSQGFCVSPTLPSCNTREIAGENVNDDTTFNMGRSSGFVQLAYQTFDIPDQVYVTTPGSNIHIADTGCVSTGDFFNYLSFSYSGTSSLTVHVVHNCDGSSDNTRWSYVLTCP
jgi:hypothetical protein